jgi:hypothetical protein
MLSFVLFSHSITFPLSQLPLYFHGVRGKIIGENSSFFNPEEVKRVVPAIYLLCVSFCCPLLLVSLIGASG